jgi:hypothetical protein
MQSGSRVPQVGAATSLEASVLLVNLAVLGSDGFCEKQKLAVLVDQTISVRISCAGHTKRLTVVFDEMRSFFLRMRHIWVATIMRRLVTIPDWGT